MMKQAGVPIVPGSDGPLENLGDARQIARRIGYPLLVKAVAGGGGRGMRVVRDEADLVRALPLAQAEAEAAFGNGEVYLERFIERPRHVEVQVLADDSGNVLAVGERDCSIQRRHQKLIEEAPAPNLARKTRDALLSAAVKGAKAARYTNAGTLEFLLDAAGNYYFMEMNTRIQVEHPVTEMTTGLDLVAWQIRIAAGTRLTLTERDREPSGHAIECRITAEDATNDFAPSVGTVETYVAPGGPGVRVDSHLYAGYSVPPYYDSLLGKIIVWGRDRDEAAARMERALTETVITGVPQTVSFLRSIVADDQFRAATYDTGFLSRVVARNQVISSPGAGDDAVLAEV
jgi:acetyl-CoA carboxylase biotin carboxylase subunit